MPAKRQSIPVNHFSDEFNSGVFIEKISFTDLPNLDEWQQSERHDRHSFFLLDSGSITIEIDFLKHDIQSPSVIYMHPNQVHRILAFENVTVSTWAINNESLNPAYLQLLEDITPATPLQVDKETFTIIAEAVSLCIKFSERKNDKLQPLLLKDCVNALVALVTSLFLEQSKSTDQPSRFEVVTKAFREDLERHFTTLKSPTGYAEQLNISTPYLNECVKNTTGFSVTYHIQQRIILEAKRLLYHSDKSVKEIATELGYDDYPYFSRLFTKVTGMSALAFRKKEHDLL